MYKYKYQCLKPNKNVTLHLERLTYPSQLKNIILRSLEAKRLILDSTRGPDVVARRLLSILKSTDLSGFCSVDWILSVNSKESWERLSLSMQKLVVGPNIEFEKPHVSERLLQVERFRILVPSEWVIPILRERLNWFNGEFCIIPADIDFEYWKPLRDRKAGEILIYRKFDYSESDFFNVVKICNSMGIKYRVVTYGKYTRRSYRRTLGKCRAAIWLGTSESQGLALLECWSMNVPTLVRSHESFADVVTGRVFASSPAPYLDRECGEVISASNLNLGSISNFLNESRTKNPREYVLSEFSPAKSLEKLISVLY